MIKRKSTLDQTEKAKRNRQTQVFRILDLCLQVPTDDRILIRNHIKDGDEQLSNRIYQCKKDKNYQSLQIYLRKHVQKTKKNNGCFGMMGFSSKQCSSRRGKTPLTLKSKAVATESSYQNSFHNSLQSSPSAKKIPPKAQINLTKFQIQRHIESEIDRQIYEGINNQQCIPYCRGITPRQQQNSSLFINPSNQPQPNYQTPCLKYSHFINSANIAGESKKRQIPLNIKTILKEKMKRKMGQSDQGKGKRITLNRQLEGEKENYEKTQQKQTRRSENLNKSSFYYKTIVGKGQEKDSLSITRSGRQNERTPTGQSGYSYRRQSYRDEGECQSGRNPRYGEFYKRIRMAIEGDE